jgi:diguanylate cyclase (GGDEF)-like protein
VPIPLSRSLPWLLATLVLYLLAARLSIGFIRGPDDVALIWLPAGVALAAVILLGRRALLAVLAAVLLMHLLLVAVPLTFLPFSMAANALGALVGAAVYRGFGGDADSKLTVQTGFRILLGGLALALCSAAVGTTGLIVSGLARTEQGVSAALAWMLGDLFGVIALTATLLLGAAAVRRQLQQSPPEPQAAIRRGVPEYLLWSVLSLGVLAVVFAVGARSGSQALGLAGLPMTLLLWSAIRFPPLLTFILTTGFALIVAALTGLGIGGFQVPSGAVESAVLVVFLCITMVVPQILAATIHENRIAALKMLRRALRDPLTGLPNRAAFEEDLRGALAMPSGRPLLVAYLDLDQFKIINDTLSHAAGDALLRELSGVIRAELPEHAYLFRIGGDEVAVLQPGVHEGEAVHELEQLCQTIADFRFGWQSGLVSTRASIGWVLADTDEIDPGTLLAQVDAACFTAKELGGNRVQLATADTAEVLAQTDAMRSATRVAQAIEEDRFELHCQAIASLKTGAEGRAHLEILLRMRLPGSDALIAPGQFVPAAERFRLGERLDRHVVDRVLGWFDAHPQHAARVGSIAVNLTAAAVESDSFADFVQHRLARSRIAPAQLCLELTETSAVRDLSRAQRFMQRMRALGCRIALDDFGTGFCSFAYLNSLDVDYLKVDASFVRELSASAPALAIVRAIAEIAHVMDRRTIAEGVETDAVRERLVAYFGRPA